MKYGIWTIVGVTAVLLLLAIGLAMPATAQDFKKGEEAYGRVDYATALREWRPLAEQGNAYAQSNLGTMYASGQGLPQDHGEAAKWYRKAAEQDHAVAQTNLGIAYYHGWGVAQDHTEAAKWYRKAAEQGSADAQINLGFLYHKGLGMPQDNVNAYMWFILAAVQGHKGAQNNRDAIAGRMWFWNRWKAERLAREWMEKQPRQ